MRYLVGVWLYVPNLSESLNCAPDTAASLSRSSTPGSEPELWVTLSGTPTQRPVSWRGWKTRPWISRLSGTISQRSRATSSVVSWIWSALGSHVSRGPLPARRVELRTIAGSGRRSPASFVAWDRASSSWRTCPDSTQGKEPEVFPTSSRILPTSGSMRNGVCFQQPPLEPRTSGSGSGSWPTPTAGDTRCPSISEALGSNQGKGSKRHAGTTLNDAAVLWGTPVANDDQKSPEAHLAMKGRMGGGRKEPTSLTVQAKLWSTPTASDHEGNGFRSGERSSEPKLAGQAKLWSTPAASAGSRGSDPVRTNDRAGGMTLRQQVEDGQAGLPVAATKTAGDSGSPTADLNPRFVESLMGLPDGWSDPLASLTACTFSATDWFPSAPPKRSFNLPIERAS